MIDLSLPKVKNQYPVLSPVVEKRKKCEKNGGQHSMMKRILTARCERPRQNRYARGSRCAPQSCTTIER